MPDHSRIMRTILYAVTTIALVLALLTPARLLAEESVVDREYAIKAGFIYNFARFVQWPEESFSSPAAPLTICIAGTDPFGDFLLPIESKEVNNRHISVRRIPSAKDSTEGCHILFLSGSLGDAAPALIEHVRSRPVLTIGDSPQYEDAGVMINLFLLHNRIRFFINNTRAREAGLTISSHLLELSARKVAGRLLESKEAVE